MTAPTTPPFRADHVGSLLRPTYLLDAREQFFVKRAVREAEATGCDLSGLPLEVLQGFSRAIDEDVYRALTLEGSVASRNHPGGTAPAQVRAGVARARAVGRARRRR